MTLIRWLLGRVILLADLLFAPRLRQHDAQTTARLAAAAAQITLYQFAACPFCVKVRWAARRLGVPLTVRDAKNNATDRAALLQGGGKIKVPCLRIASNAGTDQWLYESSAIVRYLEDLVAQQSLAA